ncbi:MAG: ADP-ribosylglycohydrolase family protein [Magnetococcales bacterium]|nr:ADP-ribosylglycohydrolase family protein [Magnetococcales bacterium]
MIGAIAGDMIGSPYEGRPIKSRTFPLFAENSFFTDDTVLTVAVADALLHNESYDSVFRRYGRKYPNAGYGRSFIQWFQSDDAGPYNSLGNGAAMRVAPIGWFCDSLEAVMQEARKSAEVTHNHPQGIKGAQAVAAAVFLARKNENFQVIRPTLVNQFGYDLGRCLKDIRPKYRHDVTCQGSVPEAIIAFLESTNFEDAVRNAVSLGGDSDTQAAIAGAIAEAYYGGVPSDIKKQVFTRIDKNLQQVVNTFAKQHMITSPIRSFWRNLLK